VAVHRDEDGLRDQLAMAERWEAQRRYSRGRLALYLAFFQFGLAMMMETDAFGRIEILSGLRHVLPWLLYGHLVLWIAFGVIEFLALGQAVSVTQPLLTWLGIEGGHERRRFFFVGMLAAITLALAWTLPWIIVGFGHGPWILAVILMIVWLILVWMRARSLRREASSN
jgi:hypothetical protein